MILDDTVQLATGVLRRGPNRWQDPRNDGVFEIVIQHRFAISPQLGSDLSPGHRGESSP
jgi:hypothetical protein